jgi:predicted nucleic acid-binding protein
VKVLVDTSVWSLLLRRRQRAPGGPEADELRSLIEDGLVALAGPVRQELLSGVRDRAQFERLQEKLRAFPDLVIEQADYEEAAALCNRCRAAGLQGSGVDFLLCALALRRGYALFTTDRDFDRFAGILPLRLHAARA